jgi:lipopolysaccharide/colanic/teichoic acid biosynthesis glycosyltransferase
MIREVGSLPTHRPPCLTRCSDSLRSVMSAHLRALASPSRQRPVSLSALWHLFALVALVALAGAVAWGDWRPWATFPHPGFGALIVLTAAAYSASAVASHRLSRFPLAEPSAVAIVNVTVAFAGLVGFLLFTRWYYSRSFLLTSYAIALVWQVAGHYLHARRALRIAAIAGSTPRDLAGIPGVRWSSLTEPHLDEPVDGIVVDLAADLAPEWRRLVTSCNARGVAVYDPPGIRELLTGRLSVDEAHEGLPQTLTRVRAYSAVKRLVDVIGALLVAPLVIFVGSLLALFVALESRGPVIFVQDRVGQGGRTFRLIKFRSMRLDADADGSQFAQENDRRVTRVGAFLRKYRLDELPQFWNVLRGEMSLVGPRPEQVPFVQQFEREIPMYSYRHLVPPGITGWAQVAHGYTAGLDETRVKLEYDLYYVKHLSFWLDLHILIKSIGVVLSGSGAR